MKSILYFFLRSMIATILTTITGLIAYFGFDHSSWMSILWGIGVGTISYYLLKWRGYRNLLKENQITGKDYAYIHRNLKEAQLKIKRLNKSILGIRSISGARQISKLIKVVNQIYQIVKKEPRKFYQGEQFFFYHLDSIVELADQYVFLTRQQLKDAQVRLSLSEAELALSKLQKLADDDLLLVLSDDIDHLNFELDVANQSIQRNANTLPKERG